MRCPNCDIPLGPDGFCPDCGWMGAAPTEPARPLAAAEPLPAGHTLAGRYLIQQLLSDGPIRRYAAEDVLRAAPIPVILHETPQGSPAAARLTAHYEALHGLDSPHMAAVTDRFEWFTQVYLAVADPPDSPLDRAWPAAAADQRLDWLIQVCQGLQSLHACGLAMLTLPPGAVRVTDGQAILCDPAAAYPLPLPGPVALPSYWAAREVFLSPGDVTPTADVYAVGALWLSLVLGEPLQATHFDGQYVPRSLSDLRPASVPPAVARAVARATHPAPEARYASVRVLARAIAEVCEQIRPYVGRAGALTDTGLARDVNEDRFFAHEAEIEGGRVTRGLFVVADGMGGAAGGADASRLAVEVLAREGVDLLERLAGQPPADEVLAALQVAIHRASGEVHTKSVLDVDVTGLGCTIVVALVRAPWAYVANVGDSTAFLVSPGDVERLSQEHTVVGELVRRGEITPAEAFGHPRRSELTRNLGHAPQAQAHTVARQLSPGGTSQAQRDRLLLCSDGLTDLVEDREIASIARASSPAEAVRRLVEMANARGGHDNITVILIPV